MSDASPLKFVKQYAHLHADILKAVATYADEVRSGKFPDEDHTFHIEK
jgi:3-methyl-2-oxobutanoate hydroxymethyltransferase